MSIRPGATELCDRIDSDCSTTGPEVSEVWRWTDGTQFWMGRAGGSAVGGAYTNWSSGQPDDDGGQDHLSVREDGTWVDGENTTSRPYVCEAP